MIKRILLPAISGGMLAASFPPLGIGWLAWIAFVPLLVALRGVGLRDGAKRAFVFGFVFFLATVYWVIHSMYFYGGVGLTAGIPVMLLLVVFLSLYAAAFGVCVSLMEGLKNLVKLFAIPAAWTALEYIRSHLFTGFPWVLTGYTQTHYAYLIQIADVLGVWGVSYLVLVINTAAYSIFRYFTSWKEKFPVNETIVAAVMLTLSLGYGFIKINEVENGAYAGKELPVGIAQGSIDQSVKWDRSYRTGTVDIYRELTRKAAGDGADLVVWPETATPFYLGADAEESQRVEEIAEETGTYILTGSPSFSFDQGSADPKFFNSAYLINPRGDITGRYDKVHLVPFGEYVPFKKLLFFVKKLTEGVGDFSSGPGPVPISFGDSAIGVLICYESIFPELASGAVKGGAGLLVNVTNDAWFGRTSAPYQHFEMAIMRAVENRTYLLRSANTGISAVVDPAGRVVRKTELFKKTVLMERVKLRKGPLTIYTRHIDLFAYFTIVFSGLMALGGLTAKRRP